MKFYLSYTILGLLIGIPALAWGLKRWRRLDTDDPMLPNHVKRPYCLLGKRTWDISRDHDDPRARRQLTAEVKARRVQAERQGYGNNVVEIRRRA